MNTLGECGKVLDDERRSFSLRQRGGLHFVAAACLAWPLITVLQLLIQDVTQKNLFTFVASAILLPLAWGFSKLLRIPFQDESPLAKLGFLMSMNQVCYLPIAMWAYAAAPHKFVMILAIITFAHLLPFSWLYKAQIYTFLAITGTLAAFLLGLATSAVVVAATTAVLMLVGVIVLFKTTAS